MKTVTIPTMAMAAATCSTFMCVEIRRASVRCGIENRDHVLSHVRRQRNRGHRTRPGTGESRARRSLHHLLESDPARSGNSRASTITRWKFRIIRCSNIRRIALRWLRAWRMWRRAITLDLLHVHYAIPHSISALLARQMTAAKRRLPFITTLHGTDITLVGADRSYFGITKFSIEQSDGVTAISEDLRRRNGERFRDRERNPRDP